MSFLLSKNITYILKGILISKLLFKLIQKFFKINFKFSKIKNSKKIQNKLKKENSKSEVALKNYSKISNNLLESKERI